MAISTRFSCLGALASLALPALVISTLLPASELAYRGSGRLDVKGVGHSLLAYRGSGRLDPAPGLAYRGSERSPLLG